MNFLNTEITQKLLPGYGSAGSHTTYVSGPGAGMFLQDLHSTSAKQEWNLLPQAGFCET